MSEILPYTAISLGIEAGKNNLPYNLNPFLVDTVRARLLCKGYDFGQSLNLIRMLEE